MQVSWIDIPVCNLENAVRFYEAIFGIELQIDIVSNRRRAIFPRWGQTGVALNEDPEINNNSDFKGIVIYFNITEELTTILPLIDQFGGRIISKVDNYNGYGAVIKIQDPDGNLVGLHRI